MLQKMRSAAVVAAVRIKRLPTASNPNIFPILHIFVAVCLFLFFFVLDLRDDF